MTKKRNNRAKSRRLTLEPLEERQLLSATWFETSTIGDNIDAFALEMWDWVNQFRADPDGMLYRIFNDPDQLYKFDSFNPKSNAVRAAKDLEVDIAIKDWMLKGKTGDELKNAVDAFLQSWYSLESASPLAISTALSTAAQNHNQAMINAKEASHQVDGEKSLADRLGSGFTDPAENIAYGGKLKHTNSGSTFSVVSYLFSAFAIDWGNTELAHRANMLSNTQTEMGVHVKETDYLGPCITTVDFATGTQGARSDGAFLFGLIYNDRNGDGLYTAQSNEGLSPSSFDDSGYKITVTCKTGDNKDSSVNLTSTGNGLSANGAYQIFLENGEYEVKIAGGAFGEGYTRTVKIADGENVKADFTIQGLTLGKPTLDLDTESVGTGAAAEFLEAGDAVRLVTNYKIEASELTRMRIAFESRPDGTNEMLNVEIPTGSNLRVLRNTVTGDIEIFGSNDIGVYGEILQSLSYKNSKDGTDGFANLSERSIAVSIFNGLYWSDEAFVALMITPTLFPELSIADAFVWEWEADSSAPSGQKTLVFDVALSTNARQGRDVSFYYEVIGGTAQAGINYSATDSSGSITIKAGDNRAEIRVTVFGDYAVGDDLTLKLSVRDAVNVKNTDWTDRQIVGTIRDDDNPIEFVQNTNAWSRDVSDSFERGERRFLYAYSTQTEGLVKWSAAGNNMTVTVYAAWSQDAKPVATSKWVDGRETVEWYAAKGTKYYIKLEGLYTYRNPSLTLLALAVENQTVSVDPLLDIDGHLAASIDETLLRLGTGANQWSLPLNILAQLESLNLSASKPNAVFDFSFAGGADMSFDAGSNQLRYGDFSLDLEGFVGYVLSGGNSRETLTVTGSDKNDQLVYDGASGTLTLDYDNEETPEKVSYVFSDITNLKFNGGGGTGDVAQLSDSASNDTVVCTSNELSLSGGGHSLSVEHFNDITLATRSGGVNALSVRSSDWSNMVLQTGMIRLTGTDPNDPYQLLAVGLNSIRVDASDANGKITLFGINDGDLNYWATLGYVKAKNTKTGLSVEVVSAKDLELDGVDETRQDQVTLLDADVTDFQREATDTRQIYQGIDAYLGHLKLTLPVWATSLKKRGSDENPSTFAAEAPVVSAPLDSAPLAFDAVENAAKPLAPVMDILSADTILTSLALEPVESDETVDSNKSSPEVTDAALERIPDDLLYWWSNDTSAYRRKKYAVLF